jgi:DNA-binding XRE family transcriptional regulator
MKEFAKQVGVHPNTIQNLERNGFQGCTVETLKKIIDYIGIGFNDLDTDHKSNSHKE